MSFFFSLFLISWLAFIKFANKRKFHEFYPTCLFAMYLACAVDFFSHHFELWNYPAPNDKQTYWYHLSQQLGVYPVVVYLYLQWFPKQPKARTLGLYILAWSIFSILLEFTAIKTGSMEYKRWWNLGYSYFADWILFIIFYHHHQWRSKSK